MFCYVSQSIYDVTTIFTYEIHVFCVNTYVLFMKYLYTTLYVEVLRWYVRQKFVMDILYNIYTLSLVEGSNERPGYDGIRED